MKLNQLATQAQTAMKFIKEANQSLLLKVDNGLQEMSNGV